jgi:hypothetical protein
LSSPKKTIKKFQGTQAEGVQAKGNTFSDWLLQNKKMI